MKTSKLVGLNTKWYRHQNKITQEILAEKTHLKTVYISVVETGNTNITSNTIDSIAKALNIKPKQLLEETTAELAKKLPKRVDMYEEDF